LCTRLIELVFLFLLAIPSILIIARALRGCCLLNKLPEDTDLTLDSVVLGDNSLERTYFVDVAHEGGLGIMEVGLEF
jgi:hypothetical protein